MLESRSYPSEGRPRLATLAMAGVLLGLAEIVVSAIMRYAGLPYRSALLAGVGAGAMGLALAMEGRAVAALAVAAVAVLCKALAIPVFQMPFFCNANAYLAVMLNGAALTGVAALAGRRLEGSRIARVGAGAVAALGGVTAFYLLGVFVQPCRPLLHYDTAGGLLTYLAAKGLPAAAAAAVLMPAGWALGRRLRERVLPAWKSPGRLGYPVSAAILVACWLLNGLLVG